MGARAAPRAYNSVMDQTDDIRANALAQLKQAQHMIAEGRSELSAAYEKIKAAQKLIDEASQMLRDTPPHRPATHITGPAHE